MASNPGGLGRGGRGAALMKLLNQQVRSPGDASADGSQQPSGAFGTVPPAAGPVFGDPTPPGQAQMSAAPAPATQPQQAATAVPPPSTPQAAAQPARAESSQPAGGLGRAAMMQKLYDTRLPQAASTSDTSSEKSIETGQSLRHCVAL